MLLRHPPDIAPPLFQLVIISHAHIFLISAHHPELRPLHLVEYHKMQRHFLCEYNKSHDFSHTHFLTRSILLPIIGDILVDQSLQREIRKTSKDCQCILQIHNLIQTRYDHIV